MDRILKKQVGAAGFGGRRTGLAGAVAKLVDNLSRVSHHAVETTAKIGSDILYLSAVFVAPKVHGCGYDLLRFWTALVDAAAMGPWTHGTMDDKRDFKTLRRPLSHC